MLRLKLPTDPRWVNIAEKNIEEILTDHAFCEQKSASTAISLLITYPELSELVTKMSALAIEEMEHFQMVHNIMLKRGYTLGRERKDEYVARISTFFPKTNDRDERLIHRLLIAALIEARSCERFKVLSENINDEELARFYGNLMKSEAMHYTMFLSMAREYGNVAEVDKKWQDLLTFEGEVMKDFGTKEYIHG